MQSGTLQNALDAVDALGPEDQRILVELVSRRLAEQRRTEISRNAAETLEAVRDGNASVGTVDDLRKDLSRDGIESRIHEGDTKAREKKQKEASLIV